MPTLKNLKPIYLRTKRLDSYHYMDKNNLIYSSAVKIDIGYKIIF